MTKTVTIRINGTPIETTIDGDGIQRLPLRPVLRYIMYRATLNLSELTILTNAGMISERDRRFIYQNIGCSVNDYADTFPNDEIDNPLWNSGT